MSKLEKLQKAVDEAYMKVLEANEEYDQALSKLEYYQETENSLEKQLAEAREDWEELLLFAKEHDAGKYLYVEASEFIKKMEQLKEKVK